MFTVDILSMHWIDNSEDDPDDICLHGAVQVTIGDQQIESPCTISAMALRMLKSLSEDHLIPNNNEQMLPCCGHFIIPNDTLDNVEIMGCTNGIDWIVERVENDIRVTTEDGAVTLLEFDAYQTEVFRVADQVEAFYHKCSPKATGDKFECDAYIAFWNEWHRRRRS